MAAVVFEDLSGTATPVSETDNPYQPLIESANEDPVEIQARYTTHRTARNSLQKAKILDPSFSEWMIDPILAKLDGPKKDPAYKDERNCIVFWGRPPQHIRNMIGEVQEELRTVAPDLWLMPLQNLHTTVLEVVFSVTEPEVNKIVSTLLQDGAAERIANITLQHRPRLIKPMISYDTAALALSFVPAAGEGKSVEEDKFTYHHLRRDVFDKLVAAGVKPASRYAVPSAHLTIGRFINQNGFVSNGVFDHEKAKKFIEKIEEINDRLQKKFWPTEEGVPEEGVWTMGQEKGLDFRKGTLWYGGGETVVLGKGH